MPLSPKMICEAPVRVRRPASISVPKSLNVIWEPVASERLFAFAVLLSPIQKSPSVNETAPVAVKVLLVPPITKGSTG